MYKHDLKQPIKFNSFLCRMKVNDVASLKNGKRTFQRTAVVSEIKRMLRSTNNRNQRKKKRIFMNNFQFLCFALQI